MRTLRVRRIGAPRSPADNRSVSRPNQENGRPFFAPRVGRAAGHSSRLSTAASRRPYRTFNIGALAVRQDQLVDPERDGRRRTNGVWSVA